MSSYSEKLSMSHQKKSYVSVQSMFTTKSVSFKMLMKLENFADKEVSFSTQMLPKQLERFPLMWTSPKSISWVSVLINYMDPKVLAHFTSEENPE